MELPAYREERKLAGTAYADRRARRSSVQGDRGVPAGVDGDVTRGPWLKIGDASPPGPRPSLAFPNVPVCARQWPPLCTFKGRKGG